LLADALGELARQQDADGRSRAVTFAVPVHRLALRLGNDWGYRTVTPDAGQIRPRRIPDAELGPAMTEHVYAAINACASIYATYFERSQLETRPALDITPDRLRALAARLRPVAAAPSPPSPPHGGMAGTIQLADLRGMADRVSGNTLAKYGKAAIGDDAWPKPGQRNYAMPVEQAVRVLDYMAAHASNPQTRRACRASAETLRKAHN
jgi:hypothetical protein